MTREELFSAVDGIEGAVKDCPFKGDFYTTVFRHGDSGKWFGIAMRAPARYFYGETARGETDVATVKCDPFLRTLLQTTYPNCVYPAYHMNKTLWVSIPLAADFPAWEMEQLLRHSFDLTDKKRNTP